MPGPVASIRHADPKPAELLFSIVNAVESLLEETSVSGSVLVESSTTASRATGIVVPTPTLPVENSALPAPSMVNGELEPVSPAYFRTAATRQRCIVRTKEGVLYVSHYD